MSRKSYAEITMKSGAVVTFPCTSVSWRSDGLGQTLKWEQSKADARRPVFFDVDEIAAVVFVDGAA